jgi:hypothetical protein
MVFASIEASEEVLSTLVESASVLVVCSLSPQEVKKNAKAEQSSMLVNLCNFIVLVLRINKNKRIGSGITGGMKAINLLHIKLPSEFLFPYYDQQFFQVLVGGARKVSHQAAWKAASYAGR